MASNFSNKRKFIFPALFFILAFFVLAKTSLATHTSGDVTGTILPGFTSAKLLSDDTDVNFGCGSSCSVEVTAAGLDGYAWAGTSNGGFFNLNASSSYQVLNDGEGNLSGSAWLGSLGELVFLSTHPSNNVVINASGEFFGYAWMQGAGKGWVEFFCPGDSCVKTDWHQAVAGGGSSGSYVPVVYGVCNLAKNNYPTETEPSGSLCSSGTQQGPVAVTENGEITGWDWLCLGSVTCVGESCNSNCQAPKLAEGEEPPPPPPEEPTECPLPGQIKADDGTCGFPPGPVDVLGGEQPEEPEEPGGGPPGPVDLLPEDGPIGTPTGLCPGPGCPEGGEPIGPDGGPVGPGGEPGGEPPGGVGIIDEFVGPVIGGIIDSLNDILPPGAVAALAGLLGGVGLLAGLLSGALSYALGIGFNAANIRALLSRGSYNFLTFLGVKKKSYIWGTAFDSDTLIGLDPAYVILHDASGVEIDTRITDINGRYGFVVTNPGTYYISANKVDYGWPSQKLAGKQSHEIYDKLYFGESIVIEKAGDVIAKDIPMDALKINWNEIAKNERGYVSKWVKKDIWTNRLTGVLFTAGFLVALVVLLSKPSPFNYIMMGVYVVTLILRRTHILKPSYKATLISKADKMPIPFAVVKVFSESGVQIARAVSNQLGRYFLLVPPGKYYATIEKKLPPGPPAQAGGAAQPTVYEKIYQSEPFLAKKIINKTFKI